MPAKKKSVAKKKSPQTTRLVLGSSSGVRITLDHTRGKQSITLETPGGRRIKLSDSSASVEIDDGNGNAVTVSPAGITISAAAKIRINAAEIVLSAGLVTVDAGTAKFSGNVQCDTLVSNSVISATYSPGVGNIW
ncbi:MAG: hypothetical protein ACXWG7_06120 [Chthoniobacterales bacterium]